jgi:predicted enzyme related to lactoylglutathione lyase
MFGLPDAQLRWSIGRPAGMRTGVEIVEISKAAGTRLERRIQDPGAFTLIAFVRDLDAVFARLTKLGTPVVTAGGAPIKMSLGAQGSGRAVIVKDPAGHFVELLQPDRAPEGQPTGSDVTAVRVRLAVDDLDKAVKLYRDALGLRARTVGEFHKDAPALEMMGLKKDAQFRFAITEVPTTGLILEFIEFKGVDRRTVRGNIQDPGSTRMQIQVRDVDAAIAVLKSAGGAVVSTGGTTVELPGRGGATTKVAIVREPNNLFLVLLQTAAPQRTP